MTALAFANAPTLPRQEKSRRITSEFEINSLRSSQNSRPDFLFPRHEIALFVDGCYWHGCPRCNYQPATNAAFWHAKIAANKKRDRLVNKTLRRRGYKVLRIREHSLKSQSQITRRLKTLLAIRTKTSPGGTP